MSDKSTVPTAVNHFGTHKIPLQGLPATREVVPTKFTPADRAAAKPRITVLVFAEVRTA